MAQSTVANELEARVREQEESWLSPLAVRSYESRGRAREEDECRLRTPFQRDRDRILHSKPFRRLKGKTQVFIDPAGDHFRTRMTHTLETTGIARGVARALRLNEDLTEAIGFGHDMGHTPFGHAGEEALDGCLRERFGTGFRHNEQSLRIAEQLNLTWEVRDGILKPTGEVEPGTHEGKIVRIVDRVAYINHDIDDAIRHGILAADDLPQDEVALLGPTGSKRIDTLVHDLVESSDAAGDIVQGEEVGAAMLSLRSFMFDEVYLGPQTRRSTRGPARPFAGSSTASPSGVTRRRDRGLSVGHDRPLRARVRGRRLVARIKDTSVDAVKAAANIVDLVEARTRLRKVGARYTGFCPFHQEKTPSFSVSPDRGTYYCFGCQAGGDAISFVRETESLDFVGAIEWLADRFNVPLEYDESSPQAEAHRHLRDRLFALLDQAASFYERVLWAESGKAVQEYLASRGLGEEVCREFRLGLCPRGRRLRRRRATKGSRPRSSPARASSPAVARTTSSGG